MSCYFLNNEGKCNVLTKTNCVNCNFRKTKEELMEGRIKAAKKLGKNPHSQYFVSKYYTAGMIPDYKKEENK